ncbi:hypothetical protein T4E_2671 [Trichinella pseudospiralis]|uniref:Uncharacterized protein n=1 Tax=Trichinella pseudospiralis TaxID=6337 RepID=A0A0V0Y9S9_TRIPS|nr:hypothetical protein T4E_2671 [Trichinella pseudospiralis]
MRPLPGSEEDRSQSCRMLPETNNDCIVAFVEFCFRLPKVIITVNMGQKNKLCNRGRSRYAVSYSIVPPKWWPAAVAAAPVDDNCPCEQYECAGSNSLLKKRSVTQTPQSNERAETKAGKNQ